MYRLTANNEEEEIEKLSEEEILEQVYASLKVKGYNPVFQLVGYIFSGDPTYVTAYQGARTLITKADREALLEEIITDYVKHRWKTVGGDN